MAIDFSKVPKIELHRHLEGSIPMEWVQKWSDHYKLPLPKEGLAGMQVTKPMPFKKALDRIAYQQRCFQNIESVHTLTYETLKSIANENIKLIELRFSPGFMAEPKQLPFHDIMEATLYAKERAEKDFEIEIGFILISSRDLGLDVCEETIDLAIRWKKEIIGVDLAGDEEHFPPELFEKPFQRAKKAGLPITIHSGEVSKPEHILTSVQKLGAQRIGHGVQAEKQNNIIEFLKKNKIALELCPTSNFCTRSVSDIRKHPLKKYLEEGIPVTINSDDPTLFGTTLTDEYRICHDILKLSIEEIKKTILFAFHHSFLSAEQKKRAWERDFKSFLR